ncbi:MAG TPA: UDP-N-acetylglucosamine pyrophosphorylase [Smithella sp.]|nr:UDP-N-acetylglucosamine pyrophosphorylase [Smithella sp.]
MTAPFSVEIGDEVNPERISGSLIIYGAARIYGRNTLISPDVKLGYEAPVTLMDCQLGPEAELKGGFFANSVFLNQAKMGSNAQVRSGCLLEEEAGGNHCVGLKQTILFPFVQLGSLINFCDCLMAGGTSRKNHSEVGSSYIHFNYTPQQDKATASLIGDVPRGVMLREPPIFLGGQGGIVGPAQMDYGTVIPAGMICRQDCKAKGMPVPLSVSSLRPKIFVPGVYSDIHRKVRHNIEYVANLLALRQWYRYVRRDFFIRTNYGGALYSAACDILDGAISERLKQLRLFVQNLSSSLTEVKLKKNFPDKVWRSQKQFLQDWPRMEACLLGGHEEKAGLKKRDSFVKIMQSFSNKGNSYLDAIHLLKPVQAKAGTCWLKDITDNIVTGCINNFHASRQKEK